jgi:hypothetical protein
MSTTALTSPQVAAERRAIEILLTVCRATRVTQARDLDFSEVLIRRERALQAELASLPAEPAAAPSEHHLAAA